MSGLRTGSLCSGYGGLDLGVQAVLGGELAWVADNDPAASAALACRFPRSPNLGDLAHVDWSLVEPVHVITAGFPCQDVSQAGRRAGLRRGSRSGVWFEVARAVAALRPPLVILENVRGLLTARGDEPSSEHLAAEAGRDAAARLLGWLEAERRIARVRGDEGRARRCTDRTARVMGLHRRAVARCRWHERRLVRAIGTVVGSLAGLGYDARWAVVSAAAAGAPHWRERVFILARSADPEREPVRGRAGGVGVAPGAGAGVGPEWERVRADDCAGGAGLAQDADGATRGERGLSAPGQASGGRSRADAGRPGGAATPANPGRAAWPGEVPNAPAAAGGGGGSPAYAEGDGRRQGGPEPARIVGGPDAAQRGDGPAADTACASAGSDAERGCDGRPQDPVGEPKGRASAAGSGGGADWRQYAPAIRRWEAVLGRPAPRPTEPGRAGERLSPRFVEWMMGLPEGWVTGVPGLSRNDQLRLLGNGCVPQQVSLALPALLGAAMAA